MTNTPDVPRRAGPRLDRIAIGVDFGEPSLAAAEWVSRELAPGAELVLVHALDIAQAAPLGAPPRKPSARVLDAAREFATERLRQVGNTLGPGAVRVEVHEDRPAPAIAAVAEACGVDLIVVGTHGKRTVPWRGLGSTAERLIRMSPVPVLLVSGRPEGSPRRLLVPVDEVDLTPAVLEWAGRVARRGGAVTLMHVLDPRWQELHHRRLATTGPPDESPVGAVTMAEATDATEAWLARLARDVAAPNGGVELVVATGAPGDEILAAARRAGADLIVMGRRGRGRVLPGVLGSTVSVVLRGAACPVLVVVDPPYAIIGEWEADQSDEPERG